MQDDKIDIKKILRDDPEQEVEPVTVDQETDDSEETEEVQEPVSDETQDLVEHLNKAKDADDSDETEEVEETEEVATDEPEEVPVPEEPVVKQAQPEPEPAQPLTAEEKKKRIMKVLVPVLMVVFAFIAKTAFFPAPKPSVAQKIQPAQTIQPPATSQWQPPEEYPESLRDPMRFGPATGQQQGTDDGPMVIKGIVFSSTPAAMISGKIVKTGDQIMGATVVEIKRESVVFRSGDKQWEQKVKR